MKTIAALMLLTAGLTFQSCKDDDETKNTAVTGTGTATITGRLTADLILNNGEKEGVSGITVTGSIDTRDLVTNPTTGNYALKTYTAVTNNDGVYKLEVDANVKEVNVSFNIPQNFTAEQTLENGSKQRRIFTRTTAVPANIAITKGQTTIQDAEYTYDVNPNTGLVKFTGTVLMRSDLCRLTPDSQLTNAAAGTIVVATWVDDEGRNRELEISTGANGKFELNIESTSAGKTISLKGRKFTASRKELVSGDCVTKSDYEYMHGGSGASGNKNETTKIADIIFQ